MTKEFIQDIRSGVCAIHFVDKNYYPERMYTGKVLNWEGHQYPILSSASGFLVQDKLVTANHILRGPKSDMVAFTISISEKVSRHIFVERNQLLETLIAGSDENNHDYVVFDAPLYSENKFHKFDFAKQGLPCVGERCLALGFPFGRPVFTAHEVMISSRYSSGVADVLRLDGSINPSNSGGPLVRISDGKVIGIVVRRETGLTGQIKLMKTELSGFRAQVRRDSVGGFARMGSVNVFDFFDGVAASFETILLELERSANVGIGHAFGVGTLMDEPCWTED